MHKFHLFFFGGGGGGCGVSIVSKFVEIVLTVI